MAPACGLTHDGSTGDAASDRAPGLQNLLEPLVNINRTFVKEVMRSFNQNILKIRNQGNGKFGSFCGISLLFVKDAIEELQWCHDNGFVGVLFNGADVYQNLPESDAPHDIEVLVNNFNLRLENYSMDTFWQECVRLNMFVYFHLWDKLDTFFLGGDMTLVIFAAL